MNDKIGSVDSKTIYLTSHNPYSFMFAVADMSSERTLFWRRREDNGTALYNILIFSFFMNFFDIFII